MFARVVGLTCIGQGVEESGVDALKLRLSLCGVSSVDGHDWHKVRGLIKA